MKSFIKEFKEFASRGNVIDLAVGVMIGAAFQAIVNSVVNDLVNPIIGLFTNGISFDNMFVALDGESYNSIAAAQEAGAPVLNFGSFIMAVINFLIVAFVIFLMVKGINKLRDVTPLKKEEEEVEPTEKECPFCKSKVSIEATRCPFCTSLLDTEEAPALAEK